MKRSILFLSVLVLLFNSCTAMNLNVKSQEELLKEEEIYLMSLSEDILNYVNETGSNGEWCLNPYMDKCIDVNKKHLMNIVKMIIDKGWDLKSFVMKAALFKNHKLAILIIFKSKIDPEMIYQSVFVVDSNIDPKKYRKYNCEEET